MDLVVQQRGERLLDSEPGEAGGWVCVPALGQELRERHQAGASFPSGTRTGTDSLESKERRINSPRFNPKIEMAFDDCLLTRVQTTECMSSKDGSGFTHSKYGS